MSSPNMYVTNVGLASVEGRYSFARTASEGDVRHLQWAESAHCRSPKSHPRCSGGLFTECEMRSVVVSGKVRLANMPGAS